MIVSGQEALITNNTNDATVIHSFIRTTMASPALTLRSSVALATGHSIPLLGFGVYQNYDARYYHMQFLLWILSHP